eukprot:792452_1
MKNIVLLEVMALLVVSVLFQILAVLFIGFRPSQRMSWMPQKAILSSVYHLDTGKQSYSDDKVHRIGLCFDEKSVFSIGDVIWLWRSGCTQREYWGTVIAVYSVHIWHW